MIESGKKLDLRIFFLGSYLGPAEKAWEVWLYSSRTLFVKLRVAEWAVV